MRGTTATRQTRRPPDWTGMQVSVDLVAAARRLDNELFRNADDATVADAARRYRMFLWLARKHPDTPLAPTKDIDEMWHIHMLHPVAYYEDCMANFGAIMDHDGGFGAASPEEWAELQELFQMTARLWEEEFGEPYVGRGAEGERKNCVRACARCAVRCRIACKKYAGSQEPHQAGAPVSRGRERSPVNRVAAYAPPRADRRR